MTKTEQKLIELAKQHNGRYSVGTCYGRGAYGGRKNYGVRERDAMFHLEKAGLITIADRQQWQYINRGYAMSGTIFVFELV